MDKTTFEDEKVKAALSGYVKVKFQADRPRRAASQGADAEFDAWACRRTSSLRPNP